MARPTKFTPDMGQLAQNYAKLGATDIEIADFLGVNVATLNRWKAENPEFCASIKLGKEVADDRVERSLYARANGYEHDEVDIRVINGEIVKTPIRKYYPPDTTAGIFWMKNRRPAEWREMKAVELTGSEGGPVAIRRIERTIIDPSKGDS